MYKKCLEQLIKPLFNVSFQPCTSTVSCLLMFPHFQFINHIKLLCFPSLQRMDDNQEMNDLAGNTSDDSSEIGASQDSSTSSPSSSGVSALVNLPADPSDRYYLTHCFVCRTMSKPEQVSSFFTLLVRHLRLSPWEDAIAVG